ncbi:hypothetical protein TCAL_14936 [Tigriopus californicus]|uniref:C2H2-type domain-containing protein n=1 Tax=Tigriopus californicus TaxID=6832 RepID=A0A553N824_TIGCA|nr:hypothetical protein TCAL_14936 [Tigriopus californicus]
MKNFTVNLNELQMSLSLARSETMELFKDILKTLGNKPNDPEATSSSASTNGSTGSITKAKRRPIFKRRFHLRQRASDIKEISGQIWECHICSYWSYSKQALKRHKFRHEERCVKSRNLIMDVNEQEKLNEDHHPKHTSPATPSRRYRMRPRSVAYNQIDGHLYQCHSCPAWFYQRNHVLRHQNNHH